jgi:ATP-binding protein involved in chromosome partitioning
VANETQPDQTEVRKQMARELAAVRLRMGRVRRKLLVLSGKGGVGKSTVAVNLALSLEAMGYEVGLLDVDIHGPSVPKLLGIEGARPVVRDNAIVPMPVAGIKTMSIGFLLQHDDAATIWRGPMKANVIKQFLKDVEWGDLDYLVIDSPPGTGDEPLSVVQLVEDATGAVIVTTPQELAVIDVRKAITFCRSLNLPVLGVIENMSGFVCPKCGEKTDIFGHGGAERMAAEMKVPYLGAIPFDPRLVESGDAGQPFMQLHADSEAAKAFAAVVRALATPKPAAAESPKSEPETPVKENPRMRIAIPTANGRLAAHFGHCEAFALVDVDPQTKRVIAEELVEAPEHQPGLLPKWLHEQGATLIIAGGMGGRAQGLFAEHGIGVVVGAPAEEPAAVVEAYLAGTLESGSNICDH